MIANSTVAEVERLLAQGQLSQRKIAKTAGVSRATVSSIAAGNRPNYAALRAQREAEQEEPPGPLERCSGCGGRVYMPCRLCRVRQLKQQDFNSRLVARAEVRRRTLEILVSHLRGAHVEQAAPAVNERRAS